MHAAGNRVPQILGCDRKLLMSVVSVAFMFAVLSWAFWAVGVALAFLITAVLVLQRVAKADPLMRVVLYRHVWYQRYYPARPPLYSRAVRWPNSWR